MGSTMASSKRVTLVLTVIGPDRPGIVEALSRVAVDHGANWEASKMMRLANRFAGILSLSVPEERAAALAGALEALGGSGLRVVTDRGEAGAEEPSRELSLELMGNDRPGIVREITRALASQQVNIEEIETECSIGAMSGQAMFQAHARLTVPATVSATDLRRALERIAADLMVELTLAEPS
jgi:glycine cleavage system regulatory protein